MQLSLVHIGPRSKADEYADLTQMYLKRISQFVPCDTASFRSEEDLLEWIARQQKKSSPLLAILDSRGRQMTSEAFASWLGAQRDEGVRQIVFAIGPADGWSEESVRRAQIKLSLGSMTMAHALARLVIAEQLYRACTILAGHPYHTGH